METQCIGPATSAQFWGQPGLSSLLRLISTPLAISLVPACTRLCQMQYKELCMPERSSPHFKDGEAEVQRGGMCSILHSF